MSGMRASMHRLNTAALDLAPRARRFLYLWTYLSGLLAIQILHLALDELVLNIWLSLALSAGFVYSFNLAPRWRPITTYGVSIVAVGLSIFFYLKLQQDILLAGGILGVLLGLLMVLLSFKAFAPGDHRFIILVCAIFIIFSAYQSYDLKLMLMLPLFLFCAGCSLYAASQIEVATRVSQTVGTDVGDAVSETRIEVGPHFLGMLLRAVIGLIILSALAFVVTPHSEEGQRNMLMNTAPTVEPLDPGQGQMGKDPNNPGGQSNGPTEAEIGLGEDFDLSVGSKLTADPRPVLQLKSHRAGYLRAQVYDVYTGSGWVKSGWMDDPERSTIEALHGPQPEGRKGSNFAASLESSSALLQADNETNSTFRVPLLDFPSLRAAKRLEVKGISIAANNIASGDQLKEPRLDEIHQEIKLVEDQPPYYFAMYAPYRLENISLQPNGNLVDLPLIDPAACLRPASTESWHRRNFSYTVRSLEPHYKPEDLKSVLSSGPGAIVDRYTQLPIDNNPSVTKLNELGIQSREYHALSERVVKLSQTVASRSRSISGQPSIYEKVLNIVDYLNDPEEFEYTRNYVEIKADEEFTEQFLFVSQQGHCRYFASTMAVMCRINNIPARIVSGYAPGSFSLVDNAYIYRASNAHAWVEVYFDGYGWITFDPSPAGGGGPSGPGGLARSLRNIIDFLTNLFVLDPAATQRMIIDGLRQLWSLMLRHGPQSLVLLASVIILVFLYLRLRGRFRRSRLIPLRPENGVIEAYLQALRLLGRLGLARGDVGLTARRAFSQASREYQPLGGPLERLLPLYERAAFSNLRPSSEESQRAQDAVGELGLLVSQRLEEQKHQRRGGLAGGKAKRGGDKSAG